MKFIAVVILLILPGFAPALKAQESPVFSLGKASTTDSTAGVQVTAVNFRNIASGNLKIVYDPKAATPVTISRGAGLAGTFDYNLKEPGVIRIGWFTYPALTISDGSVLFAIEFKKVSAGTSLLQFDGTVSDMDCQFYNGAHQKLKDEPFGLFYYPGSLTFIPLQLPGRPEVEVTAATCESPGSAAIANYDAACTYAFTPPGPVAGTGGTITGFIFGRPYTVRAICTGGSTGEESEPFTIENILAVPAPIITPASPAELCAGGSVTLTASEGKSYAWSTGETTQSIVAATPGDYWVEVTAENGCSAVSSPLTVIRCASPAFRITSINTLPGVPVEINHPVELTVGYSSSQPAAISVKWGDEKMETFPDETGGRFSALHVYPQPGIYTITFQATDASGNTTSADQTVVVYDPAGGFVTGGGWFKSLFPAGGGPPGKNALPGPKTYLSPKDTRRNLPSLQKVRFSFVIKYQKGQSVPAGNVRVHFPDGGNDFSCTTIDWLVIDEGVRAWIQGSGTLNGTGNYGFFLKATDGLKSGPDKIRIRIWNKEENNAIFYDNLIETILTGSIVIHMPEKKSAAFPEPCTEPAGDKVTLHAYPNPFSEHLNIEFSTPQPAHACLEIFDMNGRHIRTLWNGPVEAGTVYKAVFRPENREPGQYIYQLHLGTDSFSGTVICR